MKPQLVLGALLSLTLLGGYLPAQNASASVSPSVQQVLSWLPADTETVIVGQGPFTIADKEREVSASHASVSSQENGMKERKRVPPPMMSLEKRLFPMRGLEDAEIMQRLLPAQVRGRQILLAVEGSRRFRAPHGLGLMPFEGCTIAVFADDLGNIPVSFLQSARTNGLRTEQIAGQEVVVLTEKAEEDEWTLWVASPKRDVALVATDRAYLQEVLERMSGKRGARALPEDLPEWRYVDAQAQFWGLRHFDRQQATEDPSSPIRQEEEHWRDEGAIGLTFSFNPAKQGKATLTYLSENQQILRTGGDYFLNMPHESSAKSWHLTRRELQPGVIEAVYMIDNEESASLFLFMLHFMLGHGVYL